MTTATQRGMSAKLQALRQEYAEKLPRVMEEIVKLWQMIEREWEAETVKVFHRHIHRLAGNAESFGFGAVGQIARTLDLFLIKINEAQRLATPEEKNYIRQQLIQLRQASRKSQAALEETSAPAAATTERKPCVYLLDDDVQMTEYLALQLQARGYEIHTFNKATALIQQVNLTTPDVIIMDIMLTEGDLAGPKVMLHLQKGREKPLPVIFISARADKQARLAAVRANGDAYFTKPLNIDKLSEKLQQITAQIKPAIAENAPRILVVDDTTFYTEKYAKAFQQAGLFTRTLSDPNRIMVALEKFKPALVLVNTQLKSMSGLELALVIRQQDNFAKLPLIFFSKQFDQGLRRAAMRGISDDFVSEETKPQELIDLIIKRLSIPTTPATTPEAANREPLTGLYNRSYLLAQLELHSKRPVSEMNATMPLVVLYITVDSYRGMDKIIGSVATDALIKNAAAHLKANIRASDILGRFADNRFILLSIDRDLENISTFAETLRRQAEKQMLEVEGQQMLTTYSIGVGIYSQLFSSSQQALLDAQEACQEAVDMGGNCVKLHSSIIALQQKQQQQAWWERVIVLALENNQFYLAYQPIDALHGAAQAAYDVLLRFQNEQGEDIPPNEFLPIAEKTGLVIYIDRWVIKQSVMKLMTQQHLGRDLNFFIRISGPTLSDNELIMWLSDCLRASGLAPHKIIFDISQKVLEENLKDTQYFIRNIKDLGFRFCLRDFDGQKNILQILSLLTVDFIKLRADLVRNLNNEQNLNIITQSVEDAHNKDIQVIAPFVEDATHLSLLWDYHIDYITGHFVRTPEETLDYEFAQ